MPQQPGGGGYSQPHTHTQKHTWFSALLDHLLQQLGSLSFQLNWAKAKHSFPSSFSFPGGSDDKESACNVGDPVLILESGGSPGEGNGNLLQYSCLQNPMDRGTWLHSPQGHTEPHTTEGLTHFPSLSPQFGSDCIPSASQLLLGAPSSQLWSSVLLAGGRQQLPTAANPRGACIPFGFPNSDQPSLNAPLR